MIPFCDNELCRLNSVELTGPEFDVVEYTEANGNRVKTKRHIISVIGTTTTFAFCDICATVAAMVSENSSEPLSNVKASPAGGIPADDPTTGVHLTPQPKNQNEQPDANT